MYSNPLETKSETVWRPTWTARKKWTKAKRAQAESLRAHYYRTRLRAGRPRLAISKGNAKLEKWIAILSTPAGHACPGAEDCLAKIKNGHIWDSPKAKHRCFAVIQEAMFKSVHKSRWSNFELLRGARTAKEIARLLEFSWPKSKRALRQGGAGDIFSEAYFLALILVCRRSPWRTVYAYTKSIPFWAKHKARIPGNLRLVASLGGKWDSIAIANNFPTARVVFSEAEARNLGLPIDHTDYWARRADRHFALLIHGMGKAGSLQAKLHAQGRGGYRTDYGF
jgi:hypothetical protein